MNGGRTSTPPGTDQLLEQLPPALVLPDARSRIRAGRRATGRRTAALDDDPTGSQSVHDVSVVTVLDPAEYATALERPGATCFVLTNSRSLGEDDAAALTGRVGRDLLEFERRLGAPVDLVSRSDSTLRGHVRAEVAALHEARTAVAGRGYDGVLLVPAYLEAGRVTAGSVHLARVEGRFQPVGETEFARDATFGYTSSDLRGFLAERGAGDDAVAIGLDDVRRGGPDRVAELLRGLSAGRWAVVDAVEYSDLEVLALGLMAAEEGGRRYLFRSGPSFVRALAGIEPRAPLTAGEIPGRRKGHGLVVVGSHVGLTSRQLAAARSAGGFTEVEIDVAALRDPSDRDRHVAHAGRRAAAALAEADVLVSTSRELVRGEDPAASLAIARETSAAVVEVVRAALPAQPAWVVAKGGITSHDVAVRGLGIRRATVVGQLLPGQVSVFDPIEAAPDAVGTPFVVFAGNVGDEDTLAAVVAVLRGTATTATGDTAPEDAL